MLAVLTGKAIATTLPAMRNDLSSPWPAWIGGRQVPAALVTLLVLVVFMVWLDPVISRWAATWPPDLLGFFAAITDYGLSEWIIKLSLGVALLGALFSRVMEDRISRIAAKQIAGIGAFILTAVSLTGIASNLLKRLVGRARPEMLDAGGQFDYRSFSFDWRFESFPSGHTTTSFALAMAVGLVWPRAFPWALAGAIAIGLSRIGVGAHYPADVLAGVVVGVLGTYAVRYFFAERRWTFERYEDGSIRPRPFAPTLRAWLRARRGGA